MNAPALIDGAVCVVVTSGKGGVGKSTTAAALALALADRGHDVVAVDADTTGANLHQLLEVVDVELDASREPLELVLPSANGVRLASPVSIGERASADDVIAAARFAAWPEFVVVDLPAGWSADHSSVVSVLPDLVVTVVAPTETALSDHVSHVEAWNSGWESALRQLRNKDQRRKWAELADSPTILEVETMARFRGIDESSGAEVTIRRSDAVPAARVAEVAAPVSSLPATASVAELAASPELTVLVERIVAERAD